MMVCLAHVRSEARPPSQEKFRRPHSHRVAVSNLLVRVPNVIINKKPLKETLQKFSMERALKADLDREVFGVKESAVSQASRRFAQVLERDKELQVQIEKVRKGLMI